MFTARSGYDVLEILPALFMNKGNYSKARYDYWECVTFMFTRAYAGSITLRQTLELDTAVAPGAKWLFQSPPDAIVSKLLINGAEVRKFLWEPYEADIAGFLHAEAM